MDIQEINQKIETLTEELKKLKTLKNQKKIENYHVELVFNYDPESPNTIYIHLDDKRVAVNSIKELVEFCKTLPSESEEFNGFMAFLKDVMDSRNDND